jgi:uncharacterized protein GlcG (DUF336 family)
MQKINQNIAVVVVDRGGNPLTAERHELVGPHNLMAAEKSLYRFIYQNIDLSFKPKQ